MPQLANAPLGIQVRRLTCRPPPATRLPLAHFNTQLPESSPETETFQVTKKPRSSLLRLWLLLTLGRLSLPPPPPPPPLSAVVAASAPRPCTPAGHHDLTVGSAREPRAGPTPAKPGRRSLNVLTQPSSVQQTGLQSSWADLLDMSFQERFISFDKNSRKRFLNLLRLPPPCCLSVLSLLTLTALRPVLQSR